MVSGTRFCFLKHNRGKNIFYMLSLPAPVFSFTFKRWLLSTGTPTKTTNFKSEIGKDDLVKI